MVNTTTSSTKDLAAVFTQKASLVSACVHDVKDRAEAMYKSLALLDRKLHLNPQMVSGKKRDPSRENAFAGNLTIRSQGTPRGLVQNRSGVASFWDCPGG